MERLLRLFCAMAILCLNAFCTPAIAAEMTFQMINDSERAINLKLFSDGETHQQWPSKTKAYLVKPDTAVQQIKISCEEGEKICWGAWMKVQSVSGEIVGPNGERRLTRNVTHNVGVGERGQRTCEKCCHICKDGTLVPATTLRDPNSAGK